MKKHIKKILKKCLKMYNIETKRKSEFKMLKKKKNLIKKITLSETQKESINNIWTKNYGKKIPLDWHRLYTSYTGKLDKYYFPEIFFTTNLLHKLNPTERKKYLSDKILTQYLFSNIEFEKFKQIKTYLYNCNGLFYNENRIYVTRGSIKETKKYWKSNY